MPSSDAPVFFVDQCLSGAAIPKAIGEASGCIVEVHADHFPIDAEDENWLPDVGKSGWVLVTKDWKIQERPRLREALVNSKVRAFIIRGGELPRAAIIALLKLVMPKMLQEVAKYRAPFIFAIEMDGQMTPLSDLTEN